MDHMLTRGTKGDSSSTDDSHRSGERRSKDEKVNVDLKMTPERPGKEPLVKNLTDFQNGNDLRLNDSLKSVGAFEKRLIVYRLSEKRPLLEFSNRNNLKYDELNKDHQTVDGAETNDVIFRRESSAQSRFKYNGDLINSSESSSFHELSAAASSRDLEGDARYLNPKGQIRRFDDHRVGNVEDILDSNVRVQLDPNSLLDKEIPSTKSKSDWKNETGGFTKASELTGLENKYLKTKTLLLKRKENGFGFVLTFSRDQEESSTFDSLPVVQSLTSGGAAEEAGIHVGDRLIEVNRQKVSGASPRYYQKLFENHDEVMVRLMRIVKDNRDDVIREGIRGLEKTNQNSKQRSYPDAFQKSVSFDGTVSFGQMNHFTQRSQSATDHETALHWTSTPLQSPPPTCWIRRSAEEEEEEEEKWIQQRQMDSPLKVKIGKADSKIQHVFGTREEEEETAQGRRRTTAHGNGKELTNGKGGLMLEEEGKGTRTSESNKHRRQKSKERSNRRHVSPGTRNDGKTADGGDGGSVMDKERHGKFRNGEDVENGRQRDKDRAERKRLRSLEEDPEVLIQSGNVIIPLRKRSEDGQGRKSRKGNGGWNEMEKRQQTQMSLVNGGYLKIEISPKRDNGPDVIAEKVVGKIDCRHEMETRDDGSQRLSEIVQIKRDSKKEKKNRDTKKEETGLLRNLLNDCGRRGSDGTVTLDLSKDSMSDRSEDTNCLSEDASNQHQLPQVSAFSPNISKVEVIDWDTKAVLQIPDLGLNPVEPLDASSDVSMVGLQSDAFQIQFLPLTPQWRTEMNTDGQDIETPVETGLNHGSDSMKDVKSLEDKTADLSAFVSPPLAFSDDTLNSTSSLPPKKRPPPPPKPLKRPVIIRNHPSWKRSGDSVQVTAGKPVVPVEAKMTSDKPKPEPEVSNMTEQRTNGADESKGVKAPDVRCRIPMQREKEHEEDKENFTLIAERFHKAHLDKMKLDSEMENKTTMVDETQKIVDYPLPIQCSSFSEELVPKQAPRVSEDLLPKDAPKVSEELPPEQNSRLSEELVLKDAPRLSEELLPKDAPRLSEELLPKQAPRPSKDLVPNQTCRLSEELLTKETPRLPEELSDTRKTLLQSKASTPSETTPLMESQVLEVSSTNNAEVKSFHEAIYLPAPPGFGDSNNDTGGNGRCGLDGKIHRETSSHFLAFPVSTWSSDDVADWLESLHLGEHKEKFISDSIDGDMLTKLDRKWLISLGLTESQQRMVFERGLLKQLHKTVTN